MHFAHKQDRKSSSNDSIRGGKSSPNVLFVAPSGNGQLQIAKYFWSFYRPENYHAEFAALENSAINPWLNKAMQEYGHTIEQKQISSVFVLSTNSFDFGSIITLGGVQGYSALSPFMETLKILFGTSPKQRCWEIPDSDLIRGSQHEMLQYALDIRDRIEFEMAQLAQSLEDVNQFEVF